MTSVNRCGDDGCPCRNLPAPDRGDTERLRAALATSERERLAAGVRFEKALHEQDERFQRVRAQLRAACAEIDRLTGRAPGESDQ